MRCCDCEVRKDCGVVENDLTSFQSCEARNRKLTQLRSEQTTSHTATEEE